MRCVPCYCGYKTDKLTLRNGIPFIITSSKPFDIKCIIKSQSRHPDEVYGVQGVHYLHLSPIFPAIYRSQSLCFNIYEFISD